MFAAVDAFFQIDIDLSPRDYLHRVGAFRVKVSHAGYEEPVGLFLQSIYVDDVLVVRDEFHARYSVKKKEYVYLINLGKYNPCMVNYVFQYNKGFDLIKLRKAIKLLSGTHDFESFTSGKYDDYVRNVDISFIVKNNILIIKFVSSGFLRYMIRNIVGLLLDLNEGKVNLNDITDIFELKNRSSIGKPAFPGGLYLNRVIY